MVKDLDVKVVRTLEGIAQSYVAAPLDARLDICRMAYTVIEVVSRDRPLEYRGLCCRLFMSYVRLYSLNEVE